MAPVRPRLLAWSRNTELSTWRAAGFRPKLMFDRPRMIWISGNSAAIRSIPSRVSRPRRRSSSLPVQMVKVSGSISRSWRGRPCASANATRRRAISTLRSAVLAMPGSSMVSAITAAPNFLASARRAAGGSSPSSKLIELITALPPYSSSADSSTPSSVESNTSGLSTAPRRRVATSRMSAISSRPTYAVQTSSACEPSRTWVRPIATQASQSAAAWRSRNALEPLALQRSPIDR